MRGGEERGDKGGQAGQNNASKGTKARQLGWGGKWSWTRMRNGSGTLTKAQRTKCQRGKVRSDDICSQAGCRGNNEKREKREEKSNKHELKMDLLFALRVLAWAAVNREVTIVF